MLKLTRQEETPTAPRYDSETVSRVIAVAQQLERRHQETLSIEQVEAVGTELGIDPLFLRQALAQVESAHATHAPRHSITVPRWVPAFAAVVTPLLLGLLSFVLVRSAWPHIPQPTTAETIAPITVAHLLALFAPLPVSVLSGFAVGKRSVGALSGLVAALAVTPTLAYLGFVMGMATYRLADMPVLYAVFGGLLNAGLGCLGAWVRERSFPADRAGSPVSRLELIRTLRDLHAQLAQHRQHRAFLSVDVAGSTEMKLGAPPLDVEYSFGRFRDWVESIVRGCGGEMQSAAGDGVMAMFKEDAAALRAARTLQERLPMFNKQSNLLAQPFRIRCGVGAGEVPLEPGVPIGHLQSPVLDRAAKLQKNAQPGEVIVSAEVTAAALLELGKLAPLPQQPELPAFVWRVPEGGEQ